MHITSVPTVSHSHLRLLCAIGALAVVVVLSGCSTTWSEQDKAHLTSLSVTPATVAKDAYQKPDATDSPGMAQGIPQATGGGLIPALLGAAVDAAVTSHQQSKFEATEAQYLPEIAKAMTSAPTAELHRAVRQSLGQHTFFGARMSDKPGAKFTLEIEKYGLQKSPLSKSQDDIKLRVRIIAKAELKGANGDTLWSRSIAGVASRAKHAAEILKDPEFIAQGIQEAAIDFANQVITELEIKLGTRAPHRYR